MRFSARTERRGQTINQLAAEKRLHKILDKPPDQSAFLTFMSHTLGACLAAELRNAFYMSITATRIRLLFLAPSSR
jgi:hypothetical protein